MAELPCVMSSKRVCPPRLIRGVRCSVGVDDAHASECHAVTSVGPPASLTVELRRAMIGSVRCLRKSGQPMRLHTEVLE